MIDCHIGLSNSNQMVDATVCATTGMLHVWPRLGSLSESSRNLTVLSAMSQQQVLLQI